MTVSLTSVSAPVRGRSHEPIRLWMQVGILVAGASALLLATSTCRAETRHVGSKAFTESVILGEVVTLLGEVAGLQVSHREQLGGTQVVWNALTQGEISAYVEYTGTLRSEIFAAESIESLEDLRKALHARGIGMTDPLGFNNSFGLGMPKRLAAKLGIAKISDLKRFPRLRYGLSPEFIKRQEGWPSLQPRYQLPSTEVSSLEHALCYQALGLNDIDVMDVYTTDAEIKLLDVLVLEDDLRHFPKYEAVILYRLDLLPSASAWVDGMQQMAGKLPQTVMIDINARVALALEQGETRSYTERRAAADLLSEQLSIETDIVEDTFWTDLWRNTGNHLYLVIVSLTAAIVVAVPLGVLAAKRAQLSQLILGTAEIIQTIPSLALLVMLMPLVASLGFRSLGPVPAIIALFLYSLLPIIRNTYTGMNEIPMTLRESAEVLGLPRSAQLWRIELPMASRMILSGIKTTAAINVGYATLGGLIGAGGYGEPIIQGLRLSNNALLLEGAIPAAILAIAVKYLFEACERWIVPKGLKIQSES